MLNEYRLRNGLFVVGRFTVTLAAIGALGLGGCSKGGNAGDGSRGPSAAGTGPATGGNTGNGGASCTDYGNCGGAGGGRPPPVLQNPPPMEVPQGNRVLLTKNDCPGGVAADVAARLMAAEATPPGGGKLLYPYDKTMFPLGIIPPVLQWDMPATGAAIRLHMKSKLLDYTFCATLSAGTNFPLPADVWTTAAGQSLGAADPMVMDIAVDAGGSTMHLPPLTVLYSLAKLKGAIYYNTYNSPQAAAMAIGGGVVMRVIPGQQMPAVFLKSADPLGCVGCHAVSADGSRMVAEQHTLAGAFEGPSSSYNLSTSAGMTNPPPIQSNLRRAGFSALYPDGSIYATTARTVPGPIPNGATPDNVPGTFGPEDSKLFDTNTGAEITGSGIDPKAYMPTFSVDGTKLIYSAMDAGSLGHALKIMDFDRPTNKFSNGRELFRDMTQYVGWPFFMPDVVEEPAAGEVTTVPHPRGKRAVFALGGMPDWGAQSPLNPIGPPHPSDLWWIDVDSGKAVPLNAANGLDAMGNTTLPYGAHDAHKNYYPTISPVAAGGYFWVFFTSKRNYGNLFVSSDAEVVNKVENKKIWVTAIDINALPGSDPSHPAFFLDGQELQSGNIRGFAALEPCRANETMCDTGIDCCCGFCTDNKCACKPPDKCAGLDEKCTTAKDCCLPTDGSAPLKCIGGYCGYSPPLM